MIKAISLPLRSKRIHIGMDEAHGVSEGRYRQLFGYKESTKVVSLDSDSLPLCTGDLKASGLPSVYRSPSSMQRDLRPTWARSHDLERQ
jgi:hypothetical protein